MLFKFRFKKIIPCDPVSSCQVTGPSVFAAGPSSTVVGPSVFGAGPSTINHMSYIFTNFRILVNVFGPNIYQNHTY